MAADTLKTGQDALADATSTATAALAEQQSVLSAVGDLLERLGEQAQQAFAPGATAGLGAAIDSLMGRVEGLAGDLAAVASEAAHAFDPSGALAYAAAGAAVGAGLAAVANEAHKTGDSVKDATARLADLKKQLVLATDPAQAKQLRQEIALLSLEIQKAKDKLAQQQTALAGLSSSLQQMGSIGAKAFAGISGAVVGFTALADPATFRLFRFEVENLGAAVGTILSPILKAATGIIERINVAISSLPDGTKQAITILVAGAGAAGAFALVLPKLASAGTLAWNALSAGAALFAGELTVVNVLSAGIPLLVGALVTGAGALAGIGVAAGGAGEEVGVLSGIMKALGDATKPVLDALQAAWDTLVSSFSGAGKGLLDGLVIGVKVLVPVIQQLAGAVQGAAVALSVLDAINPFSYILKGAIALVGWLADVLQPAFAGISRIMTAVEDAGKELTGALSDAFGSIGSMFGALFGDAQSFGQAIQNYVIAPMKLMIDAITRAIVTLSVLIKRFREGRLGAAGLGEEINRRMAELGARGAGAAGAKTIASGTASYNSNLEEASKKLQLAGLSQPRTEAKEVKPITKEDLEESAAKIREQQERIIGGLVNLGVQVVQAVLEPLRVIRAAFRI